MATVNKIEDIKNERAKEFHKKYKIEHDRKFFELQGKAIFAAADKKAEYLAEAASVRKKYNQKLLEYIAQG